MAQNPGKVEELVKKLRVCRERGGAKMPTVNADYRAEEGVRGEGEK